MADPAQVLQSMVVKLVGEGSHYEKTLKEAENQTAAWAAKIEKEAKGAMQRQKEAMADAARITADAATPLERYSTRVAELDRHLQKGRITAETYRRTINSLNKEFGQGSEAVVQYGQKISAVGSQMKGKGTMLALGVTLPVAGMVASYSSFEDNMTKSTAVMSGVTDELRAEMEAVANTISNKSVTSAKDLAESYYFLASTGLDAQKSMAALPLVERFAVAGAFDMANATELLTDAQSALGLTSADTEEHMANLVRVSDTLVKANLLASASVEQFSAALTNEAGAAIRSLGMDLEEGVAMLAVYAAQGTKGNPAGSMMSRAIKLTAKAINDNKTVFKDLGIEFDEFMDTGKNFAQVVEGITRATEGMGPGQKFATLSMMGFEAESQQAILPLIGMTDAIRAYQKELTTAGGTTEDVANKQLTSFASGLKMVWNQVAGAGRAIGAELAPAVTWLGERVAGLIAWFSGLSDGVRRFVAVAVGVAAVVGPLLIVLGTMVGVVGALVAAWGALAATGAGAVFLAMLAPLAVVVVKVVAIAAAVWGVVEAVGALKAAADEAVTTSKENEAMEHARASTDKMLKATGAMDGGGRITRKLTDEENNGIKLINKARDELLAEIGKRRGPAKGEGEKGIAADIERMVKEAQAAAEKAAAGGVLSPEAAKAQDMLAKMDGAADAAKKVAEVEKDAAKALQEREAAMADAARITDAALTPAERYAKQVAELDKHLEQGNISAETYRRSVAQLGKDLEDSEAAAALKELKENAEVEIKFNINGVEAVLAGTADAQARLEEYRALRDNLHLPKPGGQIKLHGAATFTNQPTPKGTTTAAAKAADADTKKILEFLEKIEVNTREDGRTYFTLDTAEI